MADKAIGTGRHQRPRSVQGSFPRLAQAEEGKVIEPGTANNDAEHSDYAEAREPNGQLPARFSGKLLPADRQSGKKDGGSRDINGSLDSLRDPPHRPRFECEPCHPT